jgi:hypothetical protein
VPIVVAGYLVLCAIMLVIATLVLAVVLPVALVVGVLLAYVAAGTTLLGTGSVKPETASPSHVTREEAGLPRRRGQPPFPRDYAWPNYLAAQRKIDARTMWRRGVFILSAGWKALLAYVDYFENPLLWWALIFPPYLTWSVVAAGVLAGMCLLTAVGAVVVLPMLAVWGLLLGSLRLIDRARRRKAEGICPYCYFLVRFPSYRCIGCGVTHRDIRPSRLGAVWRRCGCGVLFPTTGSGLAARLIALCPRCDRPLRNGSVLLPEIRIAVFGPVSAGKTRLVYATLAELWHKAAGNGAVLDFIDEGSERSFRHGAVIIGSAAVTPKTPAGQLLPAITLRITKSSRQMLLHLFDAAGEFYADRDDNRELEFLDRVQGLVYVIDPFSLHWVRRQLVDTLEPVLAAANTATEDPEQVYNLTVRRLRDDGVDTAGRSLAIAVVKADLLTDLPLAADLRAGRIRTWLANAGLDNIILAAERDFARVRFFLVSSMIVPASAASVSAVSPSAPVTWLMRRAGFTVFPGASVERRRGAA